jgi:uncharacterized protein (DUF1697 family)
MTGKWVVLLRGINVNPSTRIAMADLRALVEELGYSQVTTLLQSGNVILESDAVPDTKALSAAILAKTGVKSSVIALQLEDFRAIVDANPLVGAGDDDSKLVVTFIDGDIVPGEIEHLSDDELGDERLVLAPRAIYQWCPDGILKSKLGPKFWKQFAPTVTARNVRTVNRILALADSRAADTRAR